MVNKPTAEQENMFYAAMGRSIAEWSFLEYGLAMWFTTLLSDAERNHGVSLHQVFHSGRNFNTKVDMLEAAIHSLRKSPTQKFLQELIKRARQYSSLRNRIAHDLVIFHGQHNRFQIQSHKDIHYEGKPILQKDLEIAALRFNDLGQICVRTAVINGTSPEEGLEQVLRLPPEADRHPSAQTTAKTSRRAAKRPK